MKHYNAKTLVQPKPGFTDLVVITAADLTVTTDDLLQNIAILTLNKGDVVYPVTTLDLVTEFTPDPSANATVTASVGRTASGYVDFLAASNLINAGTQIATKISYVAASTLATQVIAADTTVVYCQFDITDTDGDLATITAGELHIWLQISRWLDREVEC